MEAAQKIRHAVATVSLLRERGEHQPALALAVARVKRFQARRFAGSYSDLLASREYAAAARFFLEELYSDKDYAERDAQFARIAGAIERFFPQDVVATSVALAELHALTEGLDQAVAGSWLAAQDEQAQEPGLYVRSWRAVGRRGDRELQLETVLEIGREMARLTRMPGLRLMLKMMRGPAAAANLGSLQRFLETGFDTFAAMAKRTGGAERFLETIRERESALIAMLFDTELVACETELARILGQVR